MTIRNHYHLLGVDGTASSRDIRAAYARLVKRHHPDAAGDRLSLTLRLQDLQTAYRCLADPAARAAHDHALAEHERLAAVRRQRLRNRLHRHDRRLRRAGRRISLRQAVLIALGLAAAARVATVFIG